MKWLIIVKNSDSHQHDSNENKINIDVLLILERQVYLFLLFISVSAAIVYKLPWFNIPSSSTNIILSWLLSPILSCLDLMSLLKLTGFSLGSLDAGFTTLSSSIDGNLQFCLFLHNTLWPVSQGNLYNSNSKE